MDGVSLIEGQTLKHWEQRLANIEQNQLAIMKLMQTIMPPVGNSKVPDYISISDACKKYHISKVTINKKINLFKKIKNRVIDRLRSGNFSLINEIELQEALRLKNLDCQF